MHPVWKIPADADHGEIVVEMASYNALAITQEDARIVVGAERLGALADKLYFLNEVYKADVQDAVEHLVA